MEKDKYVPVCRDCGWKLGLAWATEEKHLTESCFVCEATRPCWRWPQGRVDELMGVKWSAPSLVVVPPEMHNITDQLERALDLHSKGKLRGVMLLVLPKDMEADPASAPWHIEGATPNGLMEFLGYMSTRLAELQRAFLQQREDVQREKAAYTGEDAEKMLKGDLN